MIYSVGYCTAVRTCRILIFAKQLRFSLPYLPLFTTSWMICEIEDLLLQYGTSFPITRHEREALSWYQFRARILVLSTSNNNF
jgi:hypothetical protein